MKRALFLAAVMLTVVLPLSAQQLREEMTVNVVEVPVFVSKNGVAVKGLTKDDFELRVNGKVHPIDSFDVLEFNRQSDEQAKSTTVLTPSRPLTQRRLMVLLFDLAHTGHNNVWRSREAVAKFVSQANENDVFSVAVYSKSLGIHYLIPFTSDRFAVMRAVQTLEPSAAGDSLGIATLASERDRTEFTPSGGGFIADAAAYAYSVDDPDRDLERRATAVEGTDLSGKRTVKFFESQLSVEKEGETKRRQMDDRHFNFALAEMADNLAPLAGVKQVVVLTEGPSPVFERDMQHDALLVHDKFRKAGVVLHAVDVGSMRAPWRDNDGDGGAAEELYTLALDTGGSVLASTGVDRSMAKLYDMQNVMYVLAFRPPATGRAKNDISVKVRRAGMLADVHYRRGYSVVSAEERSQSGLFLADVLLNDIPQNDMTVDVVVEAGPQTTVRMTVPGTELLAYGADGPLVTLDVFLYVFDEKRTVAGWTFKRLRLDLDRGRQTLEAGPYILQERFNLGPGKYAAKALWRISGEDRRGFDRTDFVVAAK